VLWIIVAQAQGTQSAKIRPKPKGSMAASLPAGKHDLGIPHLAWFRQASQRWWVAVDASGASGKIRPAPQEAPKTVRETEPEPMLEISMGIMNGERRLGPLAR